MAKTNPTIQKGNTSITNATASTTSFRPNETMRYRNDDEQNSKSKYSLRNDPPKATRARFFINSRLYNRLYENYVKDSLWHYMSDGAYSRLNNCSKKPIRTLLAFLNENEIGLTKHQIYQYVVDNSALYDAILETPDNAPSFLQINAELKNHIRALLYAIVYPHIFESFKEGEEAEQDNPVIADHLSVIAFWQRLLEDAIILDGMLDAYDKVNKSLANKSVGYNITTIYRNYDQFLSDNNIEVDLKTDASSKDTGPKPGKEAELDRILLYPYLPLLQLGLTMENKIKGKLPEFVDQQKARSYYKFIQSGKRGYDTISSLLPEIPKFINESFSKYFNIDATYNSLLDKYALDVGLYKNSRSSNYKDNMKIYMRYLIEKNTHIADMYFSIKYPSVKFYLMNGVFTNFAIFKILRQSRILATILYNDADPHYNKDVGSNENFTHPSTCDIALEFNIEDRDLLYIGELIKKISSAVSVTMFHQETTKTMKGNPNATITRTSALRFLDIPWRDLCEYLIQDTETFIKDACSSKKRLSKYNVFYNTLSASSKLQAINQRIYDHIHGGFRDPYDTIYDLLAAGIIKPDNKYIAKIIANATALKQECVQGVIDNYLQRQKQNQDQGDPTSK